MWFGYAERSEMLEEYFLIQGYKYIPELLHEELYVTKQIFDFPSDEEILDFIEQDNLDRVEIVKSYSKKQIDNHVNIDNISIKTEKDTFTILNTLEVEVGTTGIRGGDSGYGCRTYLRIEDNAGTDIKVKYILPSSKGNGGVEVILGGDSELNTFISALEFAAQYLAQHRHD